MDKLLEFLANFFLLVIGLMAMLEAGILSTNGSKSLVGLTGVVVMVAILLWPFIHIALMVRRIYPLGVVYALASPDLEIRSGCASSSPLSKWLAYFAGANPGHFGQLPLLHLPLAQV